GFGLLRVVIAEHPAREDRRRRFGVIHLPIDLAVIRHFGRHRVPGLLRDDEQSHAKTRHDFRGLGRYGRGIGASLERLERTRTDVASRLLDDRAVELAPAALEALEQHLCGLHETLTRAILIDAKTFEFDAPKTAPHSENKAAVRLMIEHRYLFSDTHGIVPGQHD